MKDICAGPSLLSISPFLFLGFSPTLPSSPAQSQAFQKGKLLRWQGFQVTTPPLPAAPRHAARKARKVLGSQREEQMSRASGKTFWAGAAGSTSGPGPASLGLLPGLAGLCTSCGRRITLFACQRIRALCPGLAGGHFFSPSGPGGTNGEGGSLKSAHLSLTRTKGKRSSGHPRAGL